MDWNERLAACREEYIEVETHQQAVEARTLELLTESRELKEADEARKNVLQGEINILVALADLETAQANLRLAEEEQSLAEQQRAILQGIVETNPPEASLAMLNGIQQKLVEQESSIPADA